MSSLPVTQRKKINQTLPMFLEVPDQESPTTFQNTIYQIIILGLAFPRKTIAKAEAVKMPLKALQVPGVQGMDFMSLKNRHHCPNPGRLGRAGRCMAARILPGNWTTGLGEAWMCVRF